MPYYIPRPQPPEQIDLTAKHIVPVIASYNISGECIPLYFRYIHQDGAHTDIAIDRLIDRRTTICHTAYICLITIADQKKQIQLTYHKDYNKWTVHIP